MITEDGCWADYRIAPQAADRPCLFLDRDGVLIEDTGYPHVPAEIVLVPEALDLVRAARASGFVVGLVTNQSGIGRGYFDWPAFAAVQALIDEAAARQGGGLDFVLACPYGPEAVVPRYRHAAHPWRKPAPGMLVAAGLRLGLAMADSAMVGDRDSDMAAAEAAGVGHRVLLAGQGRSPPAEDGSVVGRAGLGAWFARLSARDADQR